MIGTIEALGVFVLAILPGFLALRLLKAGRPPLRERGGLSELALTLVVSAAGWTALYLWRGQELLPEVLDGMGHTTRERLDAFAELAALSVLIGLGLGLLARLAAAVGRMAAARLLSPLDRWGAEGVEGVEARWHARASRWLARQVRTRSLPGYAWDRLLSRLATRRERVVCRVKTKSGDELLGVLARNGYFDWEADGRAVLFDKELVRTPQGLEIVEASRGLFVPGDEVSSLSVVDLPADAVLSEEDG